ncbi:helix-turn-helix transcriptional regulator [Pacificispira sp.]|uniref:helix-turn-helix transcriptional regulator n=1 Tax=Pacificispira sp. TaxID=2888761 RepID=UPI003BAB1AFE
MAKVQIIHDADGRPAFAVIPIDEYRAAFGDPDPAGTAATDEELFDAAMAERSTGEETVPFDVLRRMTDGEAPLKVLREWRGLTQADLAAAIGVTPNYISQIERGTGKRLSRKLEPRAAEALSIDVDLIRST